MGNVPAPGDRYAQKTQPAAAATDINWTFGQHNGSSPLNNNNWQAGNTLELPFRPLAHFDRALVHQTEMFHVVATRPHELTRYFFGPPGANNELAPGTNRLKYTADWLDHQVGPNSPAMQSGFLYRALDLLRVPTPISGMGMGG